MHLGDNSQVVSTPWIFGAIKNFCTKTIVHARNFTFTELSAPLETIPRPSGVNLSTSIRRVWAEEKKERGGKRWAGCWAAGKKSGKEKETWAGPKGKG